VSLRPHEKFGKNVHRRRMAARLTQEELAEKADISRRYLQ
jgi:transcriptional regulator with XRE-family HTH domain